MAETVEPAAQARFFARVVELETFGGYSCRSVDNMAGAQLSEHAFGNAIDISGFKLEDGREISIVRDRKRPDTQESAFLREAHAGRASSSPSPPPVWSQQQQLFCRCKPMCAGKLV